MKFRSKIFRRRWYRSQSRHLETRSRWCSGYTAIRYARRQRVHSINVQFHAHTYNWMALEICLHLGFMPVDGNPRTSQIYCLYRERGPRRTKDEVKMCSKKTCQVLLIIQNSEARNLHSVSSVEPECTWKFTETVFCVYRQLKIYVIDTKHILVLQKNTRRWLAN